MKSVSLLLLIILSTLSGGCSSDSVTGSTPSGQTLNTTTTTSTTVAAIALTATPTTVSARGTVAIAAVLTDSTGANVSDGTAVSFSVTSNSALGGVSPTATAVSGLATGTFTANSTAGTVIVTVSADGVSATISIPILGVDVGSIEFTSATPDVIGLKGSGQTETSILSFAVKDVNGQNASDGTSVTFSLGGPGGGELITPTTGSTINGVVTTTLQSGSVAGPVRVTAVTVVNTVSISSISTAVSIGGGVPSLSHFTLGPSVSNLAGLAYLNLQSTVTVYLADRFGNFNVLENTSVSFITEAGAMDTSNVTDANGVTTSLFRTQNPLPLDYAPDPGPFVAGTPVAPGPSISGNPVDGLARIVAMTRGEECFIDTNGNGIFEIGTDTFPSSCDIGEPFIDYNDNGVFDAANEIFFDVDGDETRDVPNGVWDADITIWRSVRIAFTGGPTQVSTSPAGAFAIADSGSQSFTTCVADVNGNPLMAGSTISVALASGSAGTFLGGTETTTGDGFGTPDCITYLLLDASPGETPSLPPENSIIEVSVTWRVPGRPDSTLTISTPGTVD